MILLRARQPVGPPRLPERHVCTLVRHVNIARHCLMYQITNRHLDSCCAGRYHCYVGLLFGFSSPQDSLLPCIALFPTNDIPRTIWLDAGPDIDLLFRHHGSQGAPPVQLGHLGGMLNLVPKGNSKRENMLRLSGHQSTGPIHGLFFFVKMYLSRKSEHWYRKGTNVPSDN